MQSRAMWVIKFSVCLFILYIWRPKTEKSDPKVILMSEVAANELVREHHTKCLK